MSKQLAHIDPRFVASLLIQGVHPNSIVKEIFGYTSAANFEESDWAHIQDAVVSIILSLSKNQSEACISSSFDDENCPTSQPQSRDVFLENKIQHSLQPAFNGVLNSKAIYEKMGTNTSDEITSVTSDENIGTATQLQGHGSDLEPNIFQPPYEMTSHPYSVSTSPAQQNSETTSYQGSSKFFRPLNVSLPSYYVQSFMKNFIQSLEAQNIHVAESVTELYAEILMENTFRQHKPRSDPNEKRLIGYPITVDAIPLAKFIEVTNDGNDNDEDVYYRYDIEGYDSNKFVTIEEAPNVIAAEGSTGHRTWEAALALTEYILTLKQKDVPDTLHNNVQHTPTPEELIKSNKVKNGKYLENDSNKSKNNFKSITEGTKQETLNDNNAFTLLPHYKNIIEIGAGTGLAGIVAASHFHSQRLVLTDGDDAVVRGLSKSIERNMAMLENNFKANKTYYNNEDPKFTAKRLFWGSTNDLENVLDFIKADSHNSSSESTKDCSACLINPKPTFIASNMGNISLNADDNASAVKDSCSGEAVHALNEPRQIQDSTLILAADVTYDSSLAPILFQTLSDLITKLTDKDSQSLVHVLLAATVRSQTTLDEFIEIAKSSKYGFDLKMEPIKKFTFNNEKTSPSKFYYFPPSAPDILIFSISKI